MPDPSAREDAQQLHRERKLRTWQQTGCRVVYELRALLARANVEVPSDLEGELLTWLQDERGLR